MLWRERFQWEGVTLPAWCDLNPPLVHIYEDMCRQMYTYVYIYTYIYIYGYMYVHALHTSTFNIYIYALCAKELIYMMCIAVAPIAATAAIAHTPYTLHSALHTPHYPLYCAVNELHVAFHTSHSTLYILHSRLYFRTSQFTLYI